MKKTLIALAIAAMASEQLVRASTRDIAYGFRMPAGFPGDVNRTHPFSVLPRLMTPTLASKVRLYGDPVVYDAATNSVRGFLAGDTAVTKIDGILVRPYPVQQTTGGMNATIGAAVPPDGPAVVDILREGYIIARCNNFATQQPAMGGAVFVRVAATAGALIQGGFSSVADGANTVAITNAKWCGPTDSNGITEIEVMAPGA
jgi:hypothetical protein